MGKVSLLMTKSAVVAAFGKPAFCFSTYPGSLDCNWFAPPAQKVAGLPQPLHFVGAVMVSFWKGKAIEIHLMAPDRAQPQYRNVPLLAGWRTAKGIGLGSSAASVRAAYGAASLKQVNYSAGTDLRLVSKRGGRRVETWFRFTTTLASVHEIVVLTPAG